MKVCEQCGHEFEGKLCTCKQTEKKEKKHSKQWFVILFLVIVLCVLGFIYVQFIKPNPCTSYITGSGFLLPSGCEYKLGQELQPSVLD